MKLVIPFIGELRGADARLARLAEFLGVRCETLRLEDVADRAAFLERAVPDRSACFVVNPRVMKEWFGPGGIPSDDVPILRSHFAHLLVHGLRADAFDSELVAALSQGRLKSVDAVGKEAAVYAVPADSGSFCEAFAGLSFGPVNRANDHVLRIEESDPSVQALITIGGRPFMAAVKSEKTAILFIASEDVIDLDTEVGDASLVPYFSRFIPHAMALRSVAGDESWRPCSAHASIIIDDPLLRKNYGFLNFDFLLRLANQHNFHAVIAFIPHNFRRNSSRVTRLFRENAARLSICFHGNDHTEAELASTDADFLNTLLQVAEDRIEAHHQTTGLPCDRVMVFPQGNFSVEAMEVMKFHNFDASVNTVLHPTKQPIRLTIRELARPAVLRYRGFPLFIRKSIAQTHSYDIAFNVFFGRPVLIGEHHDLFERPEPLVEIAKKINSIAPEVHWSSLATVVSHSTLARKAPDGTYHVRAYSGTVRVANDSHSLRRYIIEWEGVCGGDAVAQVLMDGIPCDGFEIDDSLLRLPVELAPGRSSTFTVVYHNHRAAVSTLGLRWNTQAFVRRRLSEVRDNYFSKNQHLLTAAKAFHRRFLK